VARGAPEPKNWPPAIIGEGCGAVNGVQQGGPGRVGSARAPCENRLRGTGRRHPPRVRPARRDLCIIFAFRKDRELARVNKEHDKELREDREQHDREIRELQERYISKAETLIAKNQEMLNSTNAVMDALSRKFTR
jgi:hypothetical protein